MRVSGGCVANRSVVGWDSRHGVPAIALAGSCRLPVPCTNHPAVIAAEKDGLSILLAAIKVCVRTTLP